MIERILYELLPMQQIMRGRRIYWISRYYFYVLWAHSYQSIHLFTMYLCAQALQIGNTHAWYVFYYVV